MKPRITLITLGVDDLETAVRFYRDGLGLQTEGIVGTVYEHGAVAFFDLQAGLKLALWPRASIAHDTGIPPGSPAPTGFTIGHNVASRAEVDDVMANASLIWFTIWSSIAHGGIMPVQAIVDETERTDLLGDIPALFLVAFVLWYLMPRKALAWRCRSHGCLPAVAGDRITPGSMSG